jgi:predicted nucleotidyltransferase
MKLDKAKEIIEDHKIDLKLNFGVKEIGIFGSYVRGEQRDTSDIDILVDFDAPLSLLKLVRLENYLSDLLEISVDLIPKNDIRQELKKRILEETIYL